MIVPTIIPESLLHLPALAAIHDKEDPVFVTLQKPHD